MGIMWLEKGDSAVGLPVKHEKLNTCLFVVPSEILNEGKRKGKKEGEKGRGKRKGKKEGREGGKKEFPRAKRTGKQTKATTNFWKTEGTWKSSRELITKR